MDYTIGEMAKKLGVAPSTLRYYEREGLLPFVDRTESGVRRFREKDYEWLQVIGCLKKTGMRLKDIRSFVEMAMQGDETIDRRLELIVRQKASVKEQIASLEETLLMLDFKEWFYRTAKEKGTTAIPARMSEEELPEQFRAVRTKLRGN